MVASFCMGKIRFKKGDYMSRTKNIIPEFTKDEQDYIKEHATLWKKNRFSLNCETNSTLMNIVQWNGNVRVGS